MSETKELKPTFQPIPTGDYLVRLSRFKEEPTNAGTGVMVKAGFEVVSGESKGRLIFHNFLVEHTNPKAQEIGNKELDQYLAAVGAGGLDGINNDRTPLEQWTEIPFTAIVNIEDAKSYKAKDGSMARSKPRNNIKKFMAR